MRWLWLMAVCALGAWAAVHDPTGVMRGDAAFGPWCGEGPLPVDAAGVSLLPDTGAWPHVGTWRVLSPCPPLPWTADGDDPTVPDDDQGWRAAQAEADTGYLYLIGLHHEEPDRKLKPPAVAPGSVSWARATLRSPRARTVYMALTVDGRAGVWVNGTRVIHGPAALDPAMEEETLLARVPLKAGENRVRVVVYANGARAKLRLQVGLGEPQPGRALPAPPARPAGAMGFRNDGNAAYPDARPVTAWDLERGINVRWRTPLLYAKAQPAIAGDRIFVTEEPQTLTCLDRRTGAVLWRREADVLDVTNPDGKARGAELRAAAEAAQRDLLALGDSHWARVAHFRARGMDDAAARKAADEADDRALAAHAVYIDYIRTAGNCVMPLAYRASRAKAGPWTGFAFATPVTDGAHVWVRYFTGVIACYDLEGNLVWRAHSPFVQSSGSECSSPVLVDGLLIMQTLHKQPHMLWMRIDRVWLLALDATTGKEVWRVDARDFRPNSTPAVMRLTNGADAMTVLVTGSGTVVRVADGAVLVPRMFGNDGYSSATVDGDLLYRFCAGPSTATQLRMLDRDTVRWRTLWARRTQEHAGGVVLRDGILFGLEGDEHGRGYRMYEAATGRPVERLANRDLKNVGANRWYTVYCPATRAGDYVFLCDRGTSSATLVGDWANVSVLQASREGCFVAHNRMDRQLDAPPVFAGDALYIRTDQGLTCIGSTGPAGDAYEAVENARYVLDDVRPTPPPLREARAIAPAAADAGPFSYGRQRFFGDLWLGPMARHEAEAAVPAVTGGLIDGAPVRVGARELKPGKLPGLAIGPAICYHQSAEVLDAAKLPGLPGQASLAATTVRNDAPRTVRVTLPGPHLRAWLRGTELRDDDRLTLAPGSYPLAILVAPGEALAPVFVRFEPSDDQAAEQAAWRARVRDNRPLLDRVIRLAPDSDEARRARELLAL